MTIVMFIINSISKFLSGFRASGTKDTGENTKNVQGGLSSPAVPPYVWTADSPLCDLRETYEKPEPEIAAVTIRPRQFKKRARFGRKAPI